MNGRMTLKQRADQIEAEAIAALGEMTTTELLSLTYTISLTSAQLRAIRAELRSREV